jgi:hypothetical protein
VATVMSQPQQTCFVVMGFGEKTDFQSQPQRTLDLDKTYRIIIKPAVEQAGLKCIRADDVMHSGVIDLPMYELLLNADVVVADLSTSNANAIYELGVRHALRPATTIVLAEEQFKFPFDLSHLVIRKYQHLGKGIDAEVAETVRAELREAIRTLVGGLKKDSPVYTFLPALRPPSIAVTLSAEAVATRVPEVARTAVQDVTNTLLLEAGRAARARSDFATAQLAFSKLNERQPTDPYITQQLALATYKSKLPTPAEALILARGILQALTPATSSDAETLGLWGAIHKRLWELRKTEPDLNEAIWAYERGFYIRNDYYTGINYAFLLNVRAAVASEAGNRGNAITDFVTAGRVRNRIIERLAPQAREMIKDDSGKPDLFETFWMKATLVEAYVGIDNEEAAGAISAELPELMPEKWMRETLDEQLGKLRPLLVRQAELLKF